MSTSKASASTSRGASAAQVAGVHAPGPGGGAEEQDPMDEDAVEESVGASGGETALRNAGRQDQLERTESRATRTGSAAHAGRSNEDEGILNGQGQPASALQEEGEEEEEEEEEELNEEERLMAEEEARLGLDDELYGELQREGSRTSQARSPSSRHLAFRCSRLPTRQRGSGYLSAAALACLPSW